jgi:hypothetical protein
LNNVRAELNFLKAAGGYRRTDRSRNGAVRQEILAILYQIFKYISNSLLLSRYQNAGQNRDIKIANRSFENVAKFRYLGTTIRNQNLILEEIKRLLNVGTIQCKTFCIFICCLKI